MQCKQITWDVQYSLKFKFSGLPCYSCAHLLPMLLSVMQPAFWMLTMLPEGDLNFPTPVAWEFKKIPIFARISKYNINLFYFQIWEIPASSVILQTAWDSSFNASVSLNIDQEFWYFPTVSECLMGFMFTKIFELWLLLLLLFCLFYYKSSVWSHTIGQCPL